MRRASIARACAEAVESALRLRRRRCRRRMSRIVLMAHEGNIVRRALLARSWRRNGEWRHRHQRPRIKCAAGASKYQKAGRLANQNQHDITS